MPELTGYGPSADRADRNASVVTAVRYGTHHPARLNPRPLTDNGRRPDPDLTDPDPTSNPVEINEFRVEKEESNDAT